jgi:2-dehydro-3-deoxyphosphogluconate aldolase/(4S)-4-hydroxy-2-oxoglutarate aldolase
LVSTFLDVSPVIPVAVLHDARAAVPVAEALGAGGVGVLEVTLRTAAALDAIRAATSVPGMLVGAGTVCTPEQVKLAADAGARFLVSPGCTEQLLDAMQASGLPFLAGTATLSEMMRLLERGLCHAKLFPASDVGGVGLLRAVHAALPQMRFCPTGGITAGSAAGYLAQPNVACVGGSWLTPQDAIAAGDWARIKQLAREAVALGKAAARAG